LKSNQKKLKINQEMEILEKNIPKNKFLTILPKISYYN